MAKRITVVFFLYIFFAAAVVLRIASIGNLTAEEADYQSDTRYLTIGETRGMIYDRNMKPLVNRAFHTMLAVNPTADAMEVLKTELTEDDYSVVSAKAKTGRPFLFVCDYYSGDCADIKTTVVYDRYSDSDVAAHLIGYLDSEGNGVCGAEKAFEKILRENSGNSGVRYKSDANGKILGGNGFDTADNNYASSGGVVLTIDYDIQRVCENAMKWNNLEKGAVVVVDAENSEILAMASSPVYDRNNLASALNDENQPFFNRVLGAYPVGSVFKPVVAAAALENGISENEVFCCNGFCEVSDVVFNCHKRSGHGVLDMTGAMAVSCNMYYVSLGLETGRTEILKTASLLGFGKETILADGIVSASGNLPDEYSVDSSAALANLSFGQGELLATPLQIACVYAAFSNGGYYSEPTLVKGYADNNGILQNEQENVKAKVLADSICEKIMQMLKVTVEEGSGTMADAMTGTVYGKTATAETGKTDNGRKKVHTWFAGIYENDGEKYVIVVFRENGEYSSTDCAPVFRDIADGISGN